MKKKVLSILLSVCLLIGCLPLAASAAEAGEVTYAINGGTLTFDKKTGEIKDAESVTGSLTIPSSIEGVSVSSIGLYAFSDRTTLTSITIPSSVTSIGNYAFDGCSGLASINFPGSVASIGSNAFSRCTGLTSITFPNGLTSIGDTAFSGCTGLTSITISDSVASIGKMAFSFCTNLTSIMVDPGNAKYKSENGILFSKDGTELVIYPEGKKGSYTIPNSVTSLGSAAFSNCTSLTSITIPNSVTSLGNNAFRRCTGLTSVTIPDSVTSIGNFAFLECPNLTIYGVAGSAAETYAKENNIPFVANGQSVTPPTPVNPDPPKPSLPTQFTDVPAGEYYVEAVKWAVENNITKGTSTTKFSPNNTCTRAQAVTFLWRAAGSPEPASSSNPFTDVKPGEYYDKAVLWAVEKGITNGATKTTFNPNGKCIREQIVTFLYRAEGSPAVTGGSFTDVAAGSYYENAVKWAVANEITNGTSANKFSPKNNCTRGQIVTFLYRYSN